MIVMRSLLSFKDKNRNMWSTRTEHRRRQRLNENAYVFDNTFRHQATRETTADGS